MNLHVTGHHLDVTPAIHDYLTSKMDRLTRHFDHVIDVNVILSVEREQRKAEASVHLRGRDLFAESQDPDMYAAIDGLVNKLDRQIVKHKEKRAGARTDGSLEPPAQE
jgi:putative sigma-54 modulation protein